jgi:hypothetical protein
LQEPGFERALEEMIVRVEKHEKRAAARVE